MRRKDREITDLNMIKDIVNSCKVCRMGVVSEGVAYVVPMNFGYKEENGLFTFYFHGAIKGRKMDALRESERVCIELDEINEVFHVEKNDNFTCKYRSIIGFGKPILIEDMKEKREALQYVLNQYPEFDGLPFSDKMLPATAVYMVTVDELTAKGHL